MNEDRAGPAVRRPCRRPARPVPRDHRLAARGGLHHERRQVPAARQPRPRAGRDRGLRPVPAAPAGGARSGARRDARAPLDGPLHARRADRPGARHAASGRSGDGRRATRWSTPCTTRPPRSDRRRSSARATTTSPAIPAALAGRPGASGGPCAGDAGPGGRATDRSRAVAVEPIRARIGAGRRAISSRRLPCRRTRRRRC